MKKKALTIVAKILLLFACIAQSAAAFEGDYIWEERFNAVLTKAQLGFANDQYTVGNMYFMGRGTNLDHTKALHWYLLAGEQGHRKAAYKAGYLYRYGEALKLSPWKALEWLRKSALADYAPAQYELGKLFMSGLLGKRDRARALMWIGKARAAHFEPANVAFETIVGQIIKKEATTVGGAER